MAGSENLANSLKTITDSQNVSFLDAARSAGYARDEDDLSSAFLNKGTYSAFVELHIEQGPILEDEGTHLCTNIIFILAKTSVIIIRHLFLDSGISIGIVTAIAAPASLRVEFEGNGGHAGAVLMPNRWLLSLNIYFSF